MQQSEWFFKGFKEDVSKIGVFHTAPADGLAPSGAGLMLSLLLVWNSC